LGITFAVLFGPWRTKCPHLNTAPCGAYTHVYHIKKLSYRHSTVRINSGYANANWCNPEAPTFLSYHCYERPCTVSMTPRKKKQISWLRDNAAKALNPTNTVFRQDACELLYERKSFREFYVYWKAPPWTTILRWKKIKWYLHPEKPTWIELNCYIKCGTWISSKRFSAKYVKQPAETPCDRIKRQRKQYKLNTGGFGKTRVVQKRRWEERPAAQLAFHTQCAAHGDRRMQK